MDASTSFEVWGLVGGFVVFFVLLISGAYFLYWYTHLKGANSPFTGDKLGKGEEILYPTSEKIFLFLSSLHYSENPSFDLSKSAFCKKTGRIFPSSINRFGEVDLPRSYLKKYAKGKLTPWFRIKDSEREKIEQMHKSLDGFQTGKELKPGPLYANRKTGILVGWKSVPGTEMEILVVQNPNK